MYVLTIITAGASPIRLPGLLLMLACATAAKAKDGGKEEQMTQVSISSAFDSPQVLQECLTYLRQTAQDQVADTITRHTKSGNVRHENHQLLYTSRRLTVACPVELLGGHHSGGAEPGGGAPGESHVRPPYL